MTPSLPPTPAPSATFSAASIVTVRLQADPGAGTFSRLPLTIERFRNYTVERLRLRGDWSAVRVHVRVDGSMRAAVIEDALVTQEGRPFFFVRFADGTTRNADVGTVFLAE